jgi:peptidoglycan hydrolase-like protein with peptidoglycan-binding domain
MPSSPQLVRSVQQSLEAKGIDVGPVDGIWGPKTHQALQQFQEKQGLDATGQLNARTLEALGIPGEQAASASSASAGASASRSGQQGALPPFEQADRDNNGRVSPEEFKSALDTNRTAQR